MMRLVSEWARELFKVLSRQRLHPLTTKCPICQQSVRLHVDNAGRRHVLAHARALYEGARLGIHYVDKVECVGSRSVKSFDPRPGERQRFKLPDSLLGG
jgi:hypothetical protein